MKPQPITEIIQLKDGRTITIETGVLARQADGAVVVRMGNTLLLATVVSAREANPSVDFLPLTIDYREKFSAAGKYPGGFFKREARPSNDEILTMRLVDRVLRPLFPKDYHAETQVMIQLLSHDENVMPDALAGLAASAAIAITDIPMEQPISEVRVARINGNLVINPTKKELELADIEMVIGATEDSVLMVEGEMDEISEKEMIEAIRFAHEAIKEQCAAQKRLAKKVRENESFRDYPKAESNEDLKQKVFDITYQKSYQIAKLGLSKHDRKDKFSELKVELEGNFTEEELTENKSLISTYYNKAQKEAVRNLILEEGIRLDGRKTTDIRPIWSEVDYLPSTHGSALFTRGETQALATVTLGTSKDANIIDSPTAEGQERFYLHYNFPPFSTGEAKPLRGTSRREIGHGNLAQRALKRIIPADTPYTIRIVSDVLESNGSSSMATVCAGTMSLMDAGIQIKKPVSGIAMGLITNIENGKYAILSDILGDEDHLGDMDFKVTGTADGITACQMDIKVKGLSYEILENALAQAKDGRLHILGKIIETISKPNETLKATAPKIVTLQIKKEFIGGVIGTGGKIIQEIQKETQTVITIQEIDDYGLIEIFGTDQAGLDDAVERINSITFEPEMGGVYSAIVKSTKPFGAFVEIKKGIEGLVHISEIDWTRLENVEDALNVGDKIEVKFIGNDPKTGKMRLSRKVLLPRPN
jgi:polyribonucleotide nucleotidyltransferase